MIIFYNSAKTVSDGFRHFYTSKSLLVSEVIKCYNTQKVSNEAGECEMSRILNVTADCKPNMHYRVDISCLLLRCCRKTSYEGNLWDEGSRIILGYLRRCRFVIGYMVY